MRLQIQRGHRWVTIDRDRTDARGRYALRGRLRQPTSARARVKTSSGATRVVGRLNVYRRALASWYGPGLFGNKLGCGGTLTTGSIGVANKHLPCGSKVTLRHRGRVLRVRVIDRGPYVGGREYDLTAATARKLGFSGHGPIQATR
ncbi:septal ring lytic transglycosylase RlpA family protein [Solirubrobacter pauli]|uniref:septal ring lytic transglycosylase RlpA family protein n=1 Tax=Solirubrobacter pauli TaxID=166793 RepID=UPI001476D0EB|nr:septal ring lytic transglycosylase RlpA family protein [Solirubrobacter pauli]